MRTLILLVIFNSMALSQAIQDNAEFTIYEINNPNKLTLKYSYKAPSAKWITNGSLTNDYNGNIDLQTSGISNYIFFYYIDSGQNPMFARGLYEFRAYSETDNRNARVFIDWRTCGIPSYTGDPDIDLEYDVSTDQFIFNGINVTNQLLNSWDLNTNITNDISCLNYYADNSLGYFVSQSNPELVWYNDLINEIEYFEIFRKIDNYSSNQNSY